ncbi:TPA: DEAD/DEAH box helicase family protein, partial [Clostridioides difficile]|nr:DEAD/DEAH box helicase family protein [Clostridioides difficile]
ELLTPSQHARGRIKVRYTPYNGDWFIENKTSDYGNVKADSTYGTKRASAYRIIEDTLNLKDTRIFDYVYDEHGNKKAVFNHKETTAAQAKQEVIKQAFQDWIWKDPERRNRLVRYYNDTFNSIRTREYDGSHITFGGISPEIQLRPHQVNAIAHILYGGNTLLAHKVGAGKTFEMVAAAQESKRLGLCNKSMFVVPNHLVGQWASEYLRLYPSANILVTTKQDFETANRKKFCSRIATGDYDAVIIGHSQFEKIQMSVERQYEQLQKQLDDIERGIEDVQKSNGEQFTVKQLMKTRKAIEQKLKK